MLKVETGRILPYHPGCEKPEVRVCFNVSKPMDTSNPEWTLRSKFNVVWENCGSVRRCFSYESVIYANCNANLTS